MLQANHFEASFGTETMPICKQLLNTTQLCNCFQFSGMQSVFLDFFFPKLFQVWESFSVIFQVKQNAKWSQTTDFYFFF